MYDSLRSMSTSSLSSRIGVSLLHATPAFTIWKPAMLMHFIFVGPTRAAARTAVCSAVFFFFDSGPHRY